MTSVTRPTDGSADTHDIGARLLQLIGPVTWPRAEVEVERWDGRVLELPSRAAVRDYLLGKGVER